jgi:hypothetical protein
MENEIQRIQLETVVLFKRKDFQDQSNKRGILLLVGSPQKIRTLI